MFRQDRYELSKIKNCQKYEKIEQIHTHCMDQSIQLCKSLRWLLDHNSLGSLGCILMPRLLSRFEILNLSNSVGVFVQMTKLSTAVLGPGL